MARCSKVDPLEKFRFKVVFSSDGDGSEGSSVTAGFHDIQMPKRATNKVPYREGTDPDVSSQSAGLSTMEDIVMNRGLISALGSDYESMNGLYRWMSAVHKPGDTSSHFDRESQRDKERPVSGLDCYRKTVTIHIITRAGDTARKYKLYNAFPTNFVPASDLNAAEDGEKALESLTLAYEDFEEIDVNSDQAAAVSPEY